MSKKTKELDEVKNDTKEVVSTITSKNTKSQKANVKTDTSKKVTTKKSTIKNSSSKKTSATPKTTTRKKASTTKKAVTKKSSITDKSKKAKPIVPVEYYDLPYRYNQTTVKVLSQTPTNLFIYWDISDEDRENYKKIYGENFFEETKPVLIIHNNTLDYSFEVDINDFANSWYLHVNDSKCDYTVELGRRPLTNNNKINTDYIYISTSNKIESPNDKILFNNDEHMVYFRNTKTNTELGKSISFIRNMGKIYNIYDLYKAIYKDEDIQNISNTSSTFK